MITFLVKKDLKTFNPMHTVHPFLPLITRFSVRVYGVLINNEDEILLSDECILGNYYTKFVGGGVEFGESTKAALIREFQEEAQLDITIGEHMYTTDFFIRSQFKPEVQVICVYYKVYATPTALTKLMTTSKRFDFKQAKHGAQNFRWHSIHQLTPADVDFEAEKRVVERIKKRKE